MDFDKFGGKIYFIQGFQILAVFQLTKVIKYNLIFEKGMGRQENIKKEMTGKVYREFSRQKYNKYKAQFPKMRESEIVTKIIKEWDNLDQIAKDNLQKIYEEKNYLTHEDISSSQALMRSQLQKKEERKKAQKSAESRSPSKNLQPTRILHPSGPKKTTKSDSDFNRGSDQKDDSRVVDSDSSRLIVEGKTKSIYKGQTPYISFFKRYYEQYSKQHPRWTSSQISTIIKLLWKKNKNNNKRLSGHIGGVNRVSKKNLSGRRYYRKIKGYDGKQARYKWVRLPLQTKNHWENASKEEKQKVDLKNKYNVPLKGRQSTQNVTSSFNYLQKKLK